MVRKYCTEKARRCVGLGRWWEEDCGVAAWLTVAGTSQVRRQESNLCGWRLPISTTPIIGKEKTASIRGKMFALSQEGALD